MSHKIKKMWEETAQFWRKTKPTYRPSKIEIQLFEKYLQKVCKVFLNPKVLVLGVTPEIRNLLSRYKCSVALLDNNPVMIKAMNSLIRKKNPREKITLGDWLKMPFADGSFHLIMSDHPTSSLMYDQFTDFFREISRVLTKKGFFIVDIHVNAQLKSKSLEEYIQTYQNKKKWWKNFDNQVFTQYQVIMGNSSFYNPQTFRCQWGKLDRMIHQKFEAGKLNRKEFHDLSCKLGETNVYTFPPKSAVNSIIQRYFRIISNNQIKAHPVYQYYVPYFCQKKS